MLFKLEDNMNGAWLDRPVDKEYTYIDGYHKAFETIYKEWSDSKNDSLVFPLVFNARHAIELSIKKLLATCGEDYNRVHKLDELWKMYCPTITYDANLNSITILIQEFSSIDNNSTSFRYANNRDGETSVSLTSLDVVNFKNEINDLLIKLNGLIDMVEEGKIITK